MVKGDEVIFANYATADSLSEICFLKVKVNFRKKITKFGKLKKRWKKNVSSYDKYSSKNNVKNGNIKLNNTNSIKSLKKTQKLT